MTGLDRRSGRGGRRDRASRALCAGAGERLAPQRAVIVDLEDSTALDRDTGAVRSVQKADLVIEADALREIWTPAHLERLARTYWRFLARITLGLVRVSYAQDERSVILLAPAAQAGDLPGASI